MPSWAIAASSLVVRSMLPWSNSTSPASGLVLPVMISIIVVLPAPLGPMMARISPGASSSAVGLGRRHLVGQQAEDALGHEDRDQHEQGAEREQPIGREHARREGGL